MIVRPLPEPPSLVPDGYEPPTAPPAHRPLVTFHVPMDFRLFVQLLEAVVAVVPDADLRNDPNGVPQIVVPADYMGWAPS